MNAWVVGEAIMDVISSSGGYVSTNPGGGPANTAKALARLGCETYFVGGVSAIGFGKVIEKELVSSGVNLSLSLRNTLPTAMAFAKIDEKGLATYEFNLQDSISFSFKQNWLPKGNPKVLHLGSLAALIEPGSSELYNWASKKSAPIVFDPNVRPAIQNNRILYRLAVDRWIDIASVIKLSEEDLMWLYDESEQEIISNWMDRGVSLVVVTRAEKGLRAYTTASIVEVPAVKIEVVDSVGAGDTIGALIVESLLIYGLKNLNGEVLKSTLIRASKAAAITCSRAGANPPTRNELESFQII